MVGLPLVRFSNNDPFLILGGGGAGVAVFSCLLSDFAFSRFDLLGHEKTLDAVDVVMEGGDTAANGNEVSGSHLIRCLLLVTGDTAVSATGECRLERDLSGQTAMTEEP